ncbi:MAG: UvrD-helicase domain-containing protein [Myxococcota bacterium]
MTMVDAQAREAIRTRLDRNLVVEAAAGTGKTTALVGRMVSVLAEGLARVDSLVAVTFTEKAAGELKLRMRSELELERQRSNDPARRMHLEGALAHLEEAHINTIHGFCADLLRERPVEARIDPQFAVMTEPEAERLYTQAFSSWLQSRLEDPPEGVRRSLARRIERVWSGGEWEDDGPVERLRRAGWTLVGWRDFPTPWQRPEFARAKAIDEVLEKVHALADLTRNPRRDNDNLHQDTARARRLSDDVRRLAELGRRDDDAMESTLINLLRDRFFAKPRQGYGDLFGQGIPRQQVLSAHDALLAALRRFQEDADADLAALLHGELQGSLAGYETLKQRTGRLDFVDLLVRARDLLRDHDDVRAHFQKRFSHIFVDEFQDTDPLQAEILLLLAANDPAQRVWRDVVPAPGKLFVVGDPKQSIYRFRRADVGIYQDVKRMMEERGALCVQLTSSFRAVRTIQQVVNQAFTSVMDGSAEKLQASYVPLSPVREDYRGQPSVVVLPVPRPYGKRGITAWAIEESLPDAVGAYVHWLLTESGWTVTERERPEERIPIQPRHICLLTRRLESFGNDITRPYVQALEARSVPHLLVGGRSFHHRQEVETVRAALSAMEWPDDELSVFATLKGSLFAIPDDVLLHYRHAHGRFHPFRIPEALAAPELEPVVQALALLRRLHRERNRRPVAETISLLLEATRAHAGFVLRRSGEQALANVLHLAELARQYEASGGISFRGFVEQLQDDAGAGNAPEAPILEEGTDGVRIMTVHKAKGLEFPVVILADMTARMTFTHAARHLDTARNLCVQRIASWLPRELLEHEAEELGREEAEGVRVAYVAATRARDLLVIPGVGDGKYEGSWFSPLYDAVYPDEDRCRRPMKAPGCPAFGKDTVLERPSIDGRGMATVAPGWHVMGDHGVVWWDPQVLKLGEQPSFGLRQEELLGKDAPPDVVAADVKAHEAWRNARDAAVAQGTTPSLEVKTITERAEEPPGPHAPTMEVTVVELPRQGASAGIRYGSLVHAVLAVIPLDATAEQVQQVAEAQARVLGATAEEVRNASRAVHHALSHPILQRARDAVGRGKLRRETPVTLREPDGTLLEGVVDLAFHDGNTWTVVDFKTDAEMEKALEVYKAQVRHYAAAISSATGVRAVPVLLRI